MQHLVTFQTAEGREGSHTAPSLDDALRFVERLRNNEEASAVRLFRMQEVPLEFKAYFKVEVGEGPSDAPAAVEPVPAAEPAPEPALTSAAGANEDSTEASRRIFNRG